jgi:hypothetical protein
MILDLCLEAGASAGPLGGARRRSRGARWSSIVATALVLLVLGPRVAAQTDQPDPADDPPKPVPLFSAGMGFITPFEGGQPHLDPLVSPVFLVPIGDRWLVESRDTFESDLSIPPGSDSFHGVVQKEVDYLQLDYMANPYLTVTVGRYLTPFGIFNERLYPIWIRNLQSDPLILPIGTGPSGAGTGAMARGGFPLSPKVNVNYATYFSTRITESPVDSYRAAGGRIGLFFPGPRLEIGTSFERLLEDKRSNAFGFHFEWQPQAIPLDVRSEYARSYEGSGYWIESGYFLNQIRKAQEEFRKVQLVGRMQQYFLPPTYGAGSGGDSGWSVPWWNTQEFECGVNYYFRYNLRFVSSYGRQFSSWGNENIWTLGLTYRFVVPLGPGEMK